MLYWSARLSLLVFNWYDDVRLFSFFYLNLIKLNKYQSDHLFLPLKIVDFFFFCGESLLEKDLLVIIC